MSRFMTRVLLNGNPSSPDYEKLHNAMKSKGFSRVIQSVGNEHFWLPNAEYDRIGDLTTQQVLNDAKAAANSVKTPNEVLVTEAKSIMFDGLQKATAADARAA